MHCFRSLLLVPLALFACGESSTNNSGLSGDTTNTDKPVYSLVEFEAPDSILISANLYEADPSYPIMILSHQAKFCKYEYAGIAERFNQLGYNCLAIDLRSGGPIAENQNETWLRAKAKNKPTDYLAAEQDLVAAINWAYEKYKRPVVLVGSSYSATLSVYQAIENEKVEAVIAFSPGNYFAMERGDLIEKMIPFEKPFFLTAAREEMPFVREIVLGRPRNANQVVFTPQGEGMHGARILWPNQQDGEEYWQAVEEFIEILKNPAAIENPADTSAIN